VITVGIAEERAILVVGSPLRGDGHVLETQTFRQCVRAQYNETINSILFPTTRGVQRADLLLLLLCLFLCWMGDYYAAAAYVVNGRSVGRSVDGWMVGCGKSQVPQHQTTPQRLEVSCTFLIRESLQVSPLLATSIRAPAAEAYSRAWQSLRRLFVLHSLEFLRKSFMRQSCVLRWSI
jgi:hypothetical protein